MRHPRHTAAFVVCIAPMILMVAIGTLGATATAQEVSPGDVLLDLLNEARIDEGLDPYRQSRLLSDAAQRHADDLAENGFPDPEDVHLGSDGTDEEARIQDAGYAAWTQDDELIVAETVWSGRGDGEDALASFEDEPAKRDSLFSDTYREIGIGFATDADGRSYCVLDFGARPNVLPIFINDDAATTENPEVAIRLTNERARPDGSGTSFMGEAIEIRISNEPTFEGLAWEAWAPLVSWTLPDSVGEHTVYVEFRDAAGRTAGSADDIALDKGTPGTPTDVPVTSTPESPVSPAPESTPAEIEQTPSPGSEGVLSTPLPTPSPSSQTADATPFPTWTPLPSPEPTEVELPPSRRGAMTPSGVGNYGRLLAIVGILQGAAVFLGVYLMMRRGGSAKRG